MRGFSNFVIPCSTEYVNICGIHIRVALLGSRNFLKNLGATSKFLVPEVWHKVSSILRTHNSGVTCIPTLFVLRSIIGTCGLILMFVCKGKTCSNYIEYTGRSKSIRTDFFFKSKTHAFFILFKISSIGIYIYIQVFARSCSFWKAAENSSCWTFFHSSVTASWISATSAKWSPFNFIFNLGNRK